MKYIGTLPVFAALSLPKNTPFIPLKQYYRGVSNYDEMLSRLTPHGANQDILARLYEADIPEGALETLSDHPNRALIPETITPTEPLRHLLSPIGPVTIQDMVKMKGDEVDEVIVHSSLSSYLWTRIQNPEVVPEVDLRELPLASYHDIWRTPLSVTLHWTMRGESAIDVVKSMATTVQPHHDIKTVGRRLVRSIAIALPPERRVKHGFVFDGISRRWVFLGV